MLTVEEPGSVDGPPRRTAVRRRPRWSLWVPIAAGLSVVAGVTFAVVDRQQLQADLRAVDPGFHGGGFSPIPSVALEKLATFDTIDTHFSGDETVYKYAPGAMFGYGFHLSVQGERPVHITSLPPVNVWDAEATGVYLGAGDISERQGGTPRRLEPFEPFILEPGDVRWVEYRYRFPTCPADTQSFVFTLIGPHSVSYALRGVSRTSTFETPHAIVMEGVNGCPEWDATRAARRAAGRPDWLADDAVGVDRVGLEDVDTH